MSEFFEPFPLAAIEQSVAQRFEQIARAQPDRLALQTDTAQLGYAALNRLANRIAHAVLERRGERPEPVAVLADRSAPAIACALALAKAGKMYVPLDPAFPLARLESLRADCGAALVLAPARHAALARALGGSALEVLDVEAVGGGPGVEEDPRLAVAPDALAYLLYTSGSTGRPKGVCHSHRGLLHQVMRHTRALCIGPEDRIAMLGSASAAQANTQLFVALLNGAALFPRDLKQDGLADLTAWLTRNQISCYRSSASVFRHWARHLDARVCPSLRLVAIGGEPVRRQDVELYRAHFPRGSRLVNALSSTETGTVCMQFVDHDTPIEGAVVPVGHALDDIEILLLDERGAEVGEGEVGEIAVRSRGLAVGYWTGSRVSAEGFAPQPDDPRVRTYRSGDLGRRDGGGALLQLGRKDAVVKISGHRVDVGEVEAALRDAPGIADVAVVGRQDAGSEPRLLAYVVPAKDPAPGPAVLRRFLRERLPAYMIPSRFETLAVLPLTASGKLDRRALPAPAASPLAGEATSDSRFGILGTQLRAIWEELLGTGDIGLQDDFVELGGDSLLAIEMLLQIEKVCGRTLAPSRLLGGPISIERLVRILLEDEQENFNRPVRALQAGGSKRALFFLHGDHQNGGLYCHSLARCLGPEQPFYAVTPHGLDGDAVPWSIEAMARDRLAAVRAVQPRGPYRLGGFCTGGIVAFEMARQLEAQGEQVEALLLVDAELVNGPLGARLLGRAMRALAAGLGWSEARRRQVHLRLREGLAFRSQGARAGASGRARFVARKLRAVPRLLREMLRQRDAAPAAVESGIHAHHARHLANGVRRRDYVPGRFGGRIALFRSEHLDGRPPGGATAGWGHVAASVDVHRLPGSHQAAVTRNVAFLAEKMRPYLG